MNHIETLLDETADRLDRGIVTLIGPPQRGKTHTIHEWSRTRGRQVITILLQTWEPEAIFGYDVKHPKTGALQREMPSWLRRIMVEPTQKWTLFFDELDKAREASQAAVLTLFCNGTIEHWRLPPTVTLCAAMNEPKAPLPEALIERLLYVTFPDAETLAAKLGSFGMLRSLATEYLGVPNIRLPARQRNDGQIHKLESWANIPAFWTDDALRHVIVCGLVDAKDAPWLLEHLDPKRFALFDAVAWAKNVGPTDVTAMLVDVLNAHPDTEIRKGILSALADRANADPTGELMVALKETFKRLHLVGKNG